MKTVDLMKLFNVYDVHPNILRLSDILYEADIQYKVYSPHELRLSEGQYNGLCVKDSQDGSIIKIYYGADCALNEVASISMIYKALDKCEELNYDTTLEVNKFITMFRFYKYIDMRQYHDDSKLCNDFMQSINDALLVMETANKNGINLGF